MPRPIRPPRIPSRRRPNRAARPRRNLVNSSHTGTIHDLATYLDHPSISRVLSWLLLRIEKNHVDAVLEEMTRRRDQLLLGYQQNIRSIYRNSRENYDRKITATACAETLVLHLELIHAMLDERNTQAAHTFFHLFMHETRPVITRFQGTSTHRTSVSRSESDRVQEYSTPVSMLDEEDVTSILEITEDSFSRAVENGSIRADPTNPERAMYELRKFLRTMAFRRTVDHFRQQEPIVRHVKYPGYLIRHWFLQSVGELSFNARDLHTVLRDFLEHLHRNHPDPGDGQPGDSTVAASVQSKAIRTYLEFASTKSEDDNLYYLLHCTKPVLSHAIILSTLRLDWSVEAARKRASRYGRSLLEAFKRAGLSDDMFSGASVSVHEERPDLHRPREPRPELEFIDISTLGADDMLDYTDGLSADEQALLKTIEE